MKLTCLLAVLSLTMATAKDIPGYVTDTYVIAKKGVVKPRKCPSMSCKSKGGKGYEVNSGHWPLSTGSSGDGQQVTCWYQKTAKDEYVCFLSTPALYLCILGCRG
jgi:hypothetical protein